MACTAFAGYVAAIGAFFLVVALLGIKPNVAPSAVHLPRLLLQLLRVSGLLRFVDLANLGIESATFLMDGPVFLLALNRTVEVLIGAARRRVSHTSSRHSCRRSSACLQL